MLAQQFFGSISKHENPDGSTLVERSRIKEIKRKTGRNAVGKELFTDDYNDNVLLKSMKQQLKEKEFVF